MLIMSKHYPVETYSWWLAVMASAARSPMTTQGAMVLPVVG
jgi:hypothetical protein